MKRYYVYVRPGWIEYFETLENAQAFFSENPGSHLGEVKF